MAEVKETYEDELTCPYCGYVDYDAWELEENDGETECGRCENTFRYVRHIFIKYECKTL